MENTPPVQSADNFEQQLTTLRDILDNTLSRLSPEDIKTNNLTPSKKGGQGTVVVGTVTFLSELEMPEPVRRVAVKKLDWDHNDRDATMKQFKSFVNEVKLRAWLFHPNIALLLGFVEDITKGDAWLISPWEANGNVREFLQSGEWEIPERIALIEDVAKGVEFLHNQDPPICHGDLKSFNILVNSEYHAVITDFGSARPRPRSEARKKPDQKRTAQTKAIERTVAGLLSSLKAIFDEDTKTITLTGPGWSLRWTAPEVLDDGMQDLPSDMWALGWICWEVVTGKIPFEELNSDGRIILHTIEGRLPNIRENSQLSLVLKLCSMMSDCWHVDAGERIDATSFRKRVEIMPSITPADKSSQGPKARSSMLLLELGSMYLLQDDIVNAELHYREALEVATRTKDEPVKAHALSCLGVVYRHQSNNEEAEKACLEAHAIQSRIGNDLGAATALGGLGETYRKQSRHSEAEKAFLEAHAIHSRLRHDLGAADVLSSLAEMYLKQSRSSEAERAFQEAHATHSRLGNDLGAATALEGLGQTYGVQWRHSEVEKPFLEAYEIHSRIGNQLGAANALSGLGQTYHRQSRYSEAEKAFLKAREIYFRIHSDSGAAKALSGLGEVYGGQSRHSEAEKAFLEAHTIYSRIGDNLGSANALLGLGSEYASQSRAADSEETLLRAHKLYASVGHELGIGDTLRHLSITLHRSGRHSEAAAHCLDALAVYEKMEAPHKEAQTLGVLAHTYLTQGQHVEAENVANKMLAICMSVGDDEGQIASSTLLMSIHASQYNSLPNESSMESLLQVTESLVKLGITVDDPDITRALGDRYSKQGQYSEAEEHYRLAQAIHMSRADPNGEATALLSLGKLYSRQEQYELAEEHFAQARVAYAIAADENGEAKALDCLMSASILQRKFDAARSYCMDACEIYTRLGRPMSETCARAWELVHDL